MNLKVVTFEAPEDTLRAFDDAAASMSMNREEALRNLMEHYLAHDRGFRASVEIGIRQADAGELIDQSEIENRLHRWEQDLESSGRLR